MVVVVNSFVVSNTFFFHYHVIIPFRVGFSQVQFPTEKPTERRAQTVGAENKTCGTAERRESVQSETIAEVRSRQDEKPRTKLLTDARFLSYYA